MRRHLSLSRWRKANTKNVRECPRKVPLHAVPIGCVAGSPCNSAVDLPWSRGEICRTSWRVKQCATNSTIPTSSKLKPRPGHSQVRARGTSPATIGRFLRRLRCRLQLGERGLERRGQHAEAASAQGWLRGLRLLCEVMSSRTRSHTVAGVRSYTVPALAKVVY